MYASTFKQECVKGKRLLSLVQRGACSKPQISILDEGPAQSSTSTRRLPVLRTEVQN